MRRLFSFILGAASGALIGAAVAILMAPASGEDLRGDFRSRFNRLRDELQNAAAQRREELEQQLYGMRHPEKGISSED
ncbi:MAG TPA: YtxH domain-containing protein [Terriglobales bacterium]|nr:YtxH domain-containing protein [Terriglobales bacterium]